MGGRWGERAADPVDRAREACVRRIIRCLPYLAATEESTRCGRALQTYRVEIGDEVFHRRPVLPDIIDKNKILIVGDHLAERWPRGIGFCDSTYSRPIG